MTIIGSYRRRRIGVVIIGAFATVRMLAGCTAPGDSDTTEASPSAAADSLLPLAEGATAYPLTLTTPWGETELAERPERIVALLDDASDAELLAAIGVTPVWAPATVKRAIWTIDALPVEIEVISEWPNTGDVPWEELSATDPDLIIQTGGVIAERYDRLSDIAPVLSVETEEEVEASDWRANLELIGETLDLRNAADAAIARYDRFFDDIRAKNPEFVGLTAAYVLQYGAEYGTWYSSAAGSAEEAFFESLGFSPNPLAEQFRNDVTVSAELVSQLDADVLIIGDNTLDEDISTLLTGTPLFRQLGAVKSGQWAIIENLNSGTYGSYAFDGVEHEGNLAWAFGGGPLASIWAAEQLSPILRSTLNLG